MTPSQHADRDVTYTEIDKCNQHEITNITPVCVYFCSALVTIKITCNINRFVYVKVLAMLCYA